MNRAIKKLSALVMGAALLGSIGLCGGAVKQADAAVSDFTAVIITDANRDKWYRTPVGNATEETYDPSTRTWQGIAGMECSGNRLWAAWFAGGTTEPHKDNYVVLAYSDDSGKTWVDPFIVVHSPSDLRSCCPALWMDPDGIMHLYMLADTLGSCEMIIENPDGPIDKVALSEIKPLKGIPYNKDSRILILDDGSWLVCTETTRIVDQVILYRSTDKGQNWEEYSRITSQSEGKYFQEPSLIRHPNGDLWCLTRIEAGKGDGIERSVSHDNGKTWSTPQANLGYPYRTPGSLADMITLKDGSLLFASNNSTNKRHKMTVFLSEDGGENWYELLLDERSTTSYPALYEAADGEIYIVYDCNRGVAQSNGNYPSMEIRLAKVTREQIKAGSYDMQSQNIVISKNDEWHEIVGTENVSDKVIVVESGSTAEDVIAKMPKYLKVKLDNGSRLTLAGEWKAKRYSASENWSLEFKTNLAENLSDTYGHLQFTVQYSQDNAAGTNGALIGSIVGGCVGGAVAVAAGVTVAVVLTKKRKKKYQEENENEN